MESSSCCKRSSGTTVKGPHKNRGLLGLSPAEAFFISTDSFNLHHVLVGRGQQTQRLTTLQAHRAGNTEWDSNPDYPSSDSLILIAATNRTLQLNRSPDLSITDSTMEVPLGHKTRHMGSNTCQNENKALIHQSP